MSESVLKEKSIKVSNGDVDGGKYSLSSRELYVFSWLSMYKNLEHEVVTSLDVLNKKIPFVKTKGSNKNILERTIKSLVDKGCIEILDEDSEVYEILILNIDKNFIFIEFSKVRELSADELMIYAFLRRYDKYDAYDVSYTKWSQILRCSKKTAVKQIEEAILDGIIDKKVNNYTNSKMNNQKLQGKNTYSINKNFETYSERTPRDVRKIELAEGVSN